MLLSSAWPTIAYHHACLSAAGKGEGGGHASFLLRAQSRNSTLLFLSHTSVPGYTSVRGSWKMYSFHVEEIRKSVLENAWQSLSYELRQKKKYIGFERGSY